MIPVTERIAGPFSCNGSVDDFDFAFKVFTTADIRVALTDEDGIETDLVLTTNYTVVLNTDQVNDPGGTVTTNTVYATGNKITIDGAQAYSQTLTLTNLGGFFPKAIENAIDRIVILCQQLKRLTSRSLKIPIADGLLTVELPTAALRATKGIRFDASGNVGLTAGDPDDAGADAAASAAAAAADVVLTHADVVLTHADVVLTHADVVLTHADVVTTAAAVAAAQAAASSQLWRDVVFKTFADSPVTIATTDQGKLFSIDCSGGAVVVNLPQISTLSLATAWAMGIKKSDSSGNSITVNRGGTDTIDGSTSKTIGVAGSGTTLIPDTDTAPDMWTAADFGATAGNMTVDVFSGDGVTVAFTLSVSPGSKNNMQVLVGGVPQYKSTYSLAGTTLTFSAAPPSAANNIEVTSGTTLSIGTPADATVTGVKLADSVVNDLTTVVMDSAADYVPIADGSDSNKKKKALLPAASTTVQGIVELLTTAELKTATDTTRAATAAAILASLGYAQTFTTNSFALGTPINVAHNLPRAPVEVYALALCTSVDGSYAVGDILMVPGYNDGSQRGITIGYSSTFVFASYGVNGTAGVTKGGTSAFVMDVAKWTVVLVARA